MSSEPPVVPLDYAPRTEFDTGRFVARYLQVLAWLSIASMITDPIFFQRVNIDFTPLLYFWAASALKRHSNTARKWVLALAGIALGLVVVMVLWAVFAGTAGMSVSFGFGRRIKNPALWQVAAAAVAVTVVVAVPFVVLISERARRQFVAAVPTTTNESAQDVSDNV